MAIPYYCSKCYEIIGVESEALTLGRGFSGNFDSTIDVDCPGRGNHPKPKRTESTRLFGLIRRVLLEYPETSTTSSWEEYAGPPNKFWLWCAIVFGTKSYAGVTVNGKWAWWSLGTGFYGDGVGELANLKQRPA
jgi:hypothetical protein